ncbi:MAG: NUDIX hydrolase [Chitinophagales bacterium]
MKQNYKIYINNSIVVLAQDQQVFHIPKKMKKTSIIYCDNKEVIKNTIDDIQQEAITHNIILLSNDLKWLKDTFFSFFKVIQAGGGLTYNKEKEVLMIFRKGKWDLPKGKIEKNEKIKKGAVREVEEETGVKVEKVKKKLGKTFHTYKLKEKWILKETHWYKMKVFNTENLVPQTEEDIEKVEWIAKKEVKKKLQNSYRSIADVFDF